MTAAFRYPADVPTLDDGVVTLRAHQLSDVDAMVEQCVDPDSVTWTTVPLGYDRDDAVLFATKIMPSGWVDETQFGFALEAEHSDGVRRYAGTMSLRAHGEGVAEIAFGLHPAARGNGVCTRAVRLLLDWGFAERGFDVVVWYANVGNWASRRVAWANGFTFHGTVDKYLLQRGTRMDGWMATLRRTDDREPKHPWHVPPVLTAPGLVLRPFRDEDAVRLGEVFSDERSKQFVGRESVLSTMTDGTVALNLIREANASGRRYDWCVADADTDRLLGHVQLFNVGTGLDPTAVGAGYGTHPDARGRGVASSALTVVTEWALRPAAEDGLGMRRCFLSAAASNTASRRVAEAAGYTHITTEPQAFPVGENDFDDAVVYHVLATERPA
jgi:RimJ/RimL family protein N-acetyltransferase